MIEATLAELTAAGTPVRTSCRLLGRARATHYRRAREQARGRVHGPKERRPPGPQALDAGERAAVLTVINRAGNSDLSIGQIWVRELRRGPLLVLTVEHVPDRGRRRADPRTAPSGHPPGEGQTRVVADGPSQVWSWDITKIRGPVKGVWFHLYVLIDIYSRYNPGWLLAAAEDSVLAADFIAEAIARNGQVPHTVHADRGTSMTSQPVSALLVVDRRSV